MERMGTPTQKQRSGDARRCGESGCKLAWKTSTQTSLTHRWREQLRTGTKARERDQQRSRGVGRIRSIPQRRRGETRRCCWKRGKGEDTTVAPRPSSPEKNSGPAPPLALLPLPMDAMRHRTTAMGLPGSGLRVARLTPQTRRPAPRRGIRSRISPCTSGQCSTPATARVRAGSTFEGGTYNECMPLDGHLRLTTAPWYHWRSRAGPTGMVVER